MFTQALFIAVASNIREDGLSLDEYQTVTSVGLLFYSGQVSCG
jgi:hypothetical protein